MPKSDARHCNAQVHSALHPFFGDRLSPSLGARARIKLLRLLASKKLHSDTHFEDVFSASITSSLDYLARHGESTVRYPNAWFLVICENEVARYARALRRSRHARLESLLEGAMEIPGGATANAEMKAVLRRAMHELQPRHRKFIQCDLIERKSPDEIQDELKIGDSYYRKLKFEAFAALRAAIHAAISKGVVDTLL